MLRQIETTYRSLPTTTSGGTRLSSLRGSPRTEFLSQLIAERQRLPSQRAKRRGSVAYVLSTYDAGGRLAVRRMPPGYMTDIEV